MSALAWMKAVGVVLRLTPEDDLELDGLERLSDELYTRLLEVARANKETIVADLRSEVGVVQPEMSCLEALVRFERDPKGVVAWLANQKQRHPPDQSVRWVSAIQAEARLRLERAAQKE